MWDNQIVEVRAEARGAGPLWFRPPCLWPNVSAGDRREMGERDSVLFLYLWYCLYTSYEYYRMTRPTDASFPLYKTYDLEQVSEYYAYTVSS